MILTTEEETRIQRISNLPVVRARTGPYRAFVQAGRVPLPLERHSTHAWRLETAWASASCHLLVQRTTCLTVSEVRQYFPNGRVDKTPPANAGDTGSIPGPGRFHTPHSYWARVLQLLKLQGKIHRSSDFGDEVTVILLCWRHCEWSLIFNQYSIQSSLGQ